MKYNQTFIPLITASLILSACHSQHVSQPSAATVNTQTQVGLKPDQTLGLKGEYEIVSNGQTTNVIFKPSSTQAFSTQAIRRSDIKKYRMTVTWQGNPTGLSTTVDAASNGALTAPITVQNIPNGEFRIVMLEALDAAGQVISDLNAGHVYHNNGTGSQTQNLTRTGRLLAATIQYFLNSNVPADVTILNAWKGQSNTVLANITQFIETTLAGKDSLAFDVQALITQIKAVGTGAMPAAGSVTTANSTSLVLTYNIPTGALLPVGTRLSLASASSQMVTLPGPQTAGNHTVTIPNVYLPQGAATTSHKLRFFLPNDTSNANPIYSLSAQALSLNHAGISGPGSAASPLVLPSAMLTNVNTTTTFYVAPNGSNNASTHGASEATPWQTLGFAIAQIKAKTLAGEFTNTAPTLIVKAGTYTEQNLTLDFPIQLIGEANTLINSTTSGTAFVLGQDTASPNYTTSASKRISLSNLNLTGFNTAFSVTNSVSHLSLASIQATGVVGSTGFGFYVPAAVSVNNLNLNSCSFQQFQNGLGVYANNLDDTSDFNQVAVVSSQFSNNTHKGIYLEKANQLSLDQITIQHSGTDTANNSNNGLMIYLKGNSSSASPKTYSNISLTNSVISDSAYQGTSTFPGAYARAAVVIGVREASGHFVNLNNVNLSNNTISGPMQALRLASPDSNNNVTQSMISNLTLANNRLGLENNPAYDSTRGRFLLINHTTGNIAASGNLFDGVTASTTSDPFALENKILDKLDYNVYQTNAFVSGRVNTGLQPANQILIPFQANGLNIQAAIEAAQAGDTLVLQNGTYTPNQSLTININKDITFEGQSFATIFQRTVTATPPNLFNLTADGATLRKLTIQKMDKTGTDNIIALANNNQTLENLQIRGQYANGDGDVSRAFVGNSGITGMLVQNNVISNLRQPAYISAATAITGTIRNNQVYGTRGWVIEGARINFTGNTWRSDNQTGTSENFGCDIALLAKSNAPDPISYMTFYDPLALEASNGGDLLPLGAGMGTACDQREPANP